MENPVVKAREMRGLNRRQFALAIGKSYERVAALENGYVPALPESWRKGMESAGFDYVGLRNAYVEYQSAATAEALKLARA